MFRYNPDEEAWVEEHKLTASDGENSYKLGKTLAISGDVVVAGMPSHGNDPDAGSAYVFHLSNPFLRGDVDGNGRVSALLDGLVLVQWAFTAGDEPPCLDAADADDSGEVVALVDSLTF